MNRWDELSLKEKNTLLGIYASKGYNDLASIISHYNSYGNGGSLYHKYQTGGPDDPPDSVNTFRQLLPVDITYDEAQDWIQNWLEKRKPQLRDNYLNSRSDLKKLSD